jgi:uncharacterized protein
VTVAPALYEVTVRHVRAAPVRHEVTARSFLWLVDLDAPPSLPRPLRPLARFRAADHMGDPRASLRQNIDALLAEHGIDLAGGRVRMLASPRVLGHVFNPLSLFWCHRPDESLECVVAEVQNTYGGRHAYVLQTDETGRASVPKRFYVSPFFPADGTYTMRLPEPNDAVDVVVTLHSPDEPPFVATMRGIRRPATLRELLRLSLRHPTVTRSTVVKIRRHGIALWLRRVPVVRRPPDVDGQSSSFAGRSSVGSAVSCSKEIA